MGWKMVEEMTAREVVDTAESLAGYAEGCREIEQGINTKESVRFRSCMARIENEKLASPHEIASLHVRWNPNLGRHYDMLQRLFEHGGTLEGMRQLFAPVESL